MLKKSALLVGLFSFINGCGQDGSSTLMSTSSLIQKKFEGRSAKGNSCEITVSLEKSKVKDIEVRGKDFAQYHFSAPSVDHFYFVRSFYTFVDWLTSSEYGKQQQEKNFLPYHFLKQEDHFFFKGLTLRAEGGWYLGEVIGYPTQSTKLVLSQEIKLFGDINLSSSKMDLTSFQFKQNVRDAIPLPLGESSTTCDHLVEKN